MYIFPVSNDRFTSQNIESEGSMRIYLKGDATTVVEVNQWSIPCPSKLPVKLLTPFRKLQAHNENRDHDGAGEEQWVLICLKSIHTCNFMKCINTYIL